ARRLTRGIGQHRALEDRTADVDDAEGDEQDGQRDERELDHALADPSAWLIVGEQTEPAHCGYLLSAIYPAMLRYVMPRDGRAMASLSSIVGGAHGAENGALVPI